jgi:hypothetical protein
VKNASLLFSNLLICAESSIDFVLATSAINSACHSYSSIPLYLDNSLWFNNDLLRILYNKNNIPDIVKNVVLI